MRTLKLLLCLVLGSAPAFGALTASVQWSVIATGNANNGGGFDPSQTAGMLTNLASTSSNSATPTFSSASYTFVAGDVGDWVFVGAGASWQLGFYKITSISGNNAVVDAAIGHVILYTAATGVFSLSTVAGCGATASGTFSVDYAGPGTTASKFSDATLASVGSSTTLTDSAADFTPVDVGNMLHLTGQGTGSFGVLGWYTITAYASTTSVTTDRTTNSGTAMVAGTGAVGGGVALLSTINSASAGLGPIAGNYVWMQGSFAPSASDTIAFLGSSTAPIKCVGYLTYWGDGYALGRTNGNGPTVTTNFPAYAYTSTHTLSLPAGGFIVLENLNISSSVAGTLCTLGTNDVVTRCVLNNTDANSSAVVCTVGNDAVLENNDILESGASTATLGILCSSTGRIANNRVVVSSATGVGMSISSNPPILGNQIIGNGGGTGIASTSTSGLPTIYGNTIANWGDGINIVTGTTNIQFVVDNLITDCTNPVNNVIATNATFTAYNRYRQNTSGGTNAVVTGGSWSAATNYGAIITGLSATDYSTPWTDLRLLTTSPAVGTGWFPSASIGALQVPAVAAGQSYTGSSQ